MRQAGNDPVGAEDDAAVIEGSLQDPERFAVVFDRHAPHIHRYLARRVGHQVADDLVAETFLAAFGKRHKYDLSYPEARPWLYGIATNLVGQHHRDEVRQYRIRRAATGDPEMPGHATRVAADVTAQAIRKLLARALSELSAADRDVLVLIAWEQLTYDEAARAIGVPVGTIRSRLNRARTKLRQILADTPAAATYEEIMTNE
jgi:RNA polymerase sigma-70 factor, ECF subfamily